MWFSSGFELPPFVHTAFAKLKSDVNLEAGVTIGEYATTLSYSQNGVPIDTDETLDLILPVLAQPIVQKIVDTSVIGYVSILCS